MNMKKMIALLLTLVMMTLFAACGQNSDEGVTDATAVPGYQVRVVDALGNPYTGGVIVRFMQNGQQVTMQVVDENGVVNKDLEKGNYTVELQFTGDNAYYYDQTDLTLSAEKTSLEIVLYNAVSGEPRTLFAYSLLTDGNKDHDAYNVSVGGTYVQLTPGERNYFLFTPTEGGTYEFSVQGAEAAVGYYGSPFFVQQASVAEVVDNRFTVSVKDSMIGTGDTGTSVLVIGLDAGAEEKEAVLNIQRIGEPEWDVTDEPWMIYASTITLQPYTHPAGTSLGEFDLTASALKGK